MSEALRLPPNDRAAETGLLGAMLKDNSVIPEVMQILRPASFYQYAHQLIFDAMSHIAVTLGQTVDAVVLANLLNEREEMSEMGGAAYLVTLWESSSSNPVQCAQIIRGCAIKRAIALAAREIEEEAFAPGSDWKTVLDKAESLIFGISGKVRTTEVRPFSHSVTEMLERVDDIKTKKGSLIIPSGLTRLDAVIDGFDEGNLITIAARTGVGKTVAALNFCFNIAEQGVPCLFVSLEQPGIELAQRVVSSRGSIEAWRIRKGVILPEQEQDFLNAADIVKSSPVFLADDPDQTVMSTAAIIRQQVLKNKVQVVFIDYIQLMTPEDEKEKRHEQIGRMTRTLKKIARQTGVRIVMLAQINRESEKGADKRPYIHQLRESGSIEQDSDMILMLHRPDKESPVLEVIVGKHRHGVEAVVECRFDAARLRICDKA